MTNTTQDWFVTWYSWFDLSLRDSRWPTLRPTGWNQPMQTSLWFEVEIVEQS
jgi:hypothetical protein